MVEEADGNCRSLRVILNRDDIGFGAQKAVSTFDEDTVGEFERAVNHKQDFSRRAKLDDGVLKKDLLAWAPDRVVLVVAVVLVTVSIAVAAFAECATEFDRDTHGRGVGKESGQAVDDVLFWSASSCLVGHCNLNPGGR
ncbi:MAG TPA: hypothetical protein VK828_21605 [Terriglobales bacterium]|jgi:hypothetical protein|nr:hypothetical protein [Terriglobales bacterium]